MAQRIGITKHAYALQLGDALPVEAVALAVAAFAGLVAGWVWDGPKAYMVLHGCWHIFGAAAGYIVTGTLATEYASSPSEPEAFAARSRSDGLRFAPVVWPGTSSRSGACTSRGSGRRGAASRSTP